MPHVTRIFCLLFPCFILVLTACQRNAALQPPAPDAVKTASGAPSYLILISMDGFRWDYVERFQPPQLKAFIAGGVQAEGLIPCYPSKTFPNHYSIATGMYPNNHGLVDNSYFDLNKNARYAISNREMVEDGYWYGGTPIWVQAAKAGMVTASYFFVGSEAAVQGIRPRYYYRYDGSVPNQQRVDQVIAWLRLPEAERPRLITLYFSDLDDVGHRYGPNADEPLREKLLALDTILGRLFDGVAKTGLPVNIILVSDHGMSPIAISNLLPVEAVTDEERYTSVSNGALVHLYLKAGTDPEAVYNGLKARAEHYQVYRVREVPYFEVPPTNLRWGDLIIVPDPGFYFVNSRAKGTRQTSGPAEIGEHGFDTANRDMHGIFYARGPAIKEGGLRLPAFKNIHVYPLMCAILGLDVPADVDGRGDVLQGALRE
ncbi:MAG: alkaline phosphatase family protein [Saprospiraceae bacterium]|nr:alkaline phosphatase family protein [Saprospiraceae bacterium]